MTRAWLAALRLDFAAAFAYHPLFWVVPIAFVLAFVREEVTSSKLKRGIDIACMAVNDAFVMGAWGKDQKVEDKVLMLGDGNGEFTQAMGLTMDGSKFGLGTRSQRYAMIVDNGVIKELFVEKPGAFEVSAAEHVLKNL